MHEDWQKRIQERIHVSENDIVSMDIILDGKSISHVGIREREIYVYGCKTKVGCIGGVFTEEEYRNKGLATRLMESSVKKINEDKGDIMFVSGDRGLYRRLGCVRAGHINTFRLREDSLTNFDEGDVEISVYQEGKNLGEIVEAYQREPVRFHRTLEDFRKAAGAEWISCWHAVEALVVHRKGKFQGYLIMQKPRKENSRTVGHVAEYAGVRKAILDAVKLLFLRYGISEVIFHVPHHDVSFRYLLTSKGLKATSRSLPGTIKMINFQRLMERFYLYIEERLGAEKASQLKFSGKYDNFRISIHQEEFRIDGRNLVHIVFGTHYGKEEELMPKEGELKESLKTLFPLPFPWPGLDSY